MVAQNRAADRAAELVLDIQRFLGGGGEKVIARVKRIVADELEGGAVEVVGAGFRYYRDYCSGRSSVLGRVVACLHFELGDGFK